MALRVHCGRKEASVAAESAALLSELIAKSGLRLDLRCGGMGVCGKCAVELMQGSFEVSGKRVEAKRGAPVMALSCRTKLLSEDALVHVPENSVFRENGKIYDDFETPDFQLAPLCARACVELPEPTLMKPAPDVERLWQALGSKPACGLKALEELRAALDKGRKATVSTTDFNGVEKAVRIEAGDQAGRGAFGVAIDIGTTTVVAALVDCRAGRVLAKASCYNQQMRKADDVASRISFCSTPERLSEMRALVVKETINPLLKGVCSKAEIAPEEILRVAISGNTVMTHLFLGLPPDGIGKLPFQPVANKYPDCLGKELGLLMNPEGVVCMAPSISGYVGGDISSDIHVAGLHNAKGLSLLIDIGTNSETVLAQDGELFACAAAAGPAFEGAGLSCGCRAASGAIERIAYGEELAFKISTIDKAPATGICGSGIIDFIACGFRCGFINMFGRFDKGMLERAGRLSFVEKDGAQTLACVLVQASESGGGKDIFVSEADVEQILKAKAAVYAGAKSLLSSKGRKPAELDRLILAGGFAKYISLENAITLGMLPELPRERVHVIGNGSLAGAFLALLDASAAESFRRIAELPKTVSLNLLPDFETNYVDALAIPNCEPSEFPGVMAKLKL